jgi:hypothetical protein
LLAQICHWLSCPHALITVAGFAGQEDVHFIEITDVFNEENYERRVSSELSSLTKYPSQHYP